MIINADFTVTVIAYNYSARPVFLVWLERDGMELVEARRWTHPLRGGSVGGLSGPRAYRRLCTCSRFLAQAVPDAEPLVDMCWQARDVEGLRWITELRSGRYP